MIDHKRVKALIAELANHEVIADMPYAIEPYSEQEFGSGDNGYIQYLTGMVEGLSPKGYSHTDLKHLIAERAAKTATRLLPKHRRAAMERMEDPATRCRSGLN